MNSSLLYMECLSGISGDMFVAAMIDLGADKEVLMKVLKTIPVQGVEVKISRVKKSGLDVCDFDVVLDKEFDNHDHDMNYLYNHKITHCERHIDSASHSHRNLNDVLHIIRHTDMTQHAKNIAEKIFNILAKAEAKAHGTTIEEVHFHEVGAVDSIVDIISAAVCIDNLGINDVIITALSEGCGTIRCAHGILPIPVPAVSNIVADNCIDIKLTSIMGELITPTGAAIAAAIRTTDKLPERFVIERIGMGAGKRNYERPSILRAMLIKNTEEHNNEINDEIKDEIYKLESNIDDSTGENFGYVMERLMEAGARDVNYIPVFMKKNRPAYQLNVICTRENIEKMEDIIFSETTTIGIRRVAMERTVLKREVVTMDTSLGKAEVKICRYKDVFRIYPEYSSVVKLCKEADMSFSEVFRLIEREADEKLQRKM